jgi:uncharacterized protein (TIGR03435 family)
MNFTRKLAAFAVTGGLGIASGQSTVAAPKFEVASIRRCAAGDAPGGISVTPGRLTVNCQTVRGLIDMAYVLYVDGTLHMPGRTIVPVERGPAWINSDRYAIEAKAEGTPSLGMMRGPMLQALLETRFKLKIHTDRSEVPVYALTVAKDGPKLVAAQPGNCNPMDLDRPQAAPPPGQPFPVMCKMGRITDQAYEVRGVTMADFAVDLSRRLDRDVIDRTGIAGVFDIRVALTAGLAGQLRSNLVAPGPPPGAAAAPPPERTADTGDALGATQTLVQRLGLKLEAGKGPGRTLVIDSVERPSEN